MFDIGFTELLVIGAVALFVVGPERLPSAVRTAGLYFGRFKRSLRDVRRELELQIGADDIRRELHNEEVMKNLRNMQQDVNKTLNEKINLDDEEDFYPPGHHNHDPNNTIEEETGANTIGAAGSVAGKTKAATEGSESPDKSTQDNTATNEQTSIAADGHADSAKPSNQQ